MKNKHATSVIDDYLAADELPVPHAILVEGPWGSGKTYFLEKIYEPNRQDQAKTNGVYRTPFLFISLFGARSAADVEKRMHRAASPKEVAFGKAVGTLITGVFEALKVKDATKTALDGIEKRAARRHVEFILVFDDLERIEKGCLGEIMGLVNALITTGERRVILVGDEAKLIEIHADANWVDQNEKIVGRRVRIEADVESVIRRSVSDVHDSPSKDFMSERIDALIDLAHRSDVENLRNLSWAIVNGARFVRSLLSDREIPHDHVARTMLVVVATTLWYRSKRLTKKVLDRVPSLSTTLMVRSMARHPEATPEDVEVTAAELFSTTFADLAVESPPLEYQRIIDFEASGILDDIDFTTWTKSQFGFGEGRSEPSWRRLWHSYERPMADTEKAVEELSRELAERTYKERGQILHSAGLAIKYSKAGDTRLTNGQDVVSFFKDYIEKLVIERSLEANKIDPLPLEYDAAGGLGFSSKDTPAFTEIYQYLTKKQAEVHHVKQEERADEIVREAEAGDMEALHKLNMMNDELSRNPVLLNIDVVRMSNLIARDVPALNVGSKFLAYRYHQKRHGDPVMNEIPWARRVYECTLLKIKEWPEPHRTMSVQSFQGLIRHYEQGHQLEDQIISSEKQRGGDGD
ncbi:P-loop NTPase fold protein [Rhizobium skierniewicense]|uniref:P-loop NTPase fold protein n=1 Tax=Rhizobium skierniewicense TaxID=984260 RepID=UPI001FAC6F80|nr:P-loop NTPase fold protein [Rhizobium skierniewicense]